MSKVCMQSINPPARACSSNHIEVLARLRRRLWINSLHKLLEDDERGQAADPATIEREQAEILVWHPWGLKGISVKH